MFCGVILAALSGCIRIEQNQPSTTQSYQPSGFRYHTGTSSYTRQTVSETDSTQPEDEPPDYPPIDDIPDYPFFDDDPEFITEIIRVGDEQKSADGMVCGGVIDVLFEKL